MSTSYERTFRAEVLKENLAKVSGEALWLNSKESDKLCTEAGILANKLLLPEFDSDDALDDAEKKYCEYRKQLNKMKDKKSS